MSSFILVLVYVDVIIGTISSSHQISNFIARLAGKLSLNDLGSLSYFLGVEVIPQPHGILLSQHKYILDIITRAKMSHCKPISTPINTSEPLTLKGGIPYQAPTDYRTLVGALQHLTLTRPNISFTVNKLSQFMCAPTTLHWIALKRLIRYLQGTQHHDIILR